MTITLLDGPCAGSVIESGEVVIRIPAQVDIGGAIITKPVDADALYTDDGRYLGSELLPRHSEPQRSPPLVPELADVGAYVAGDYPEYTD